MTALVSSTQTSACDAPVLLQVAGISKWYGEQQALADVSFEIKRGEILGLIGPNGSGKTTLLEAVAGLLPVDKGNVLWRSISVANAHRRDLIFYLPDGVRPWDGQRVIHVVEFFGAAFNISPRDLEEVIRSIGIAPVLGKRICALSKGFAQRVMLAVALLTPHPFLFMDEPLDGFDLRQARDIVKVMRRIAADGRTLLLAIHQLGDAERVCDRFVLLAEGRVCGSGSLDELRTQIGQSAAGLEDIFLALT
jgi:ABC-type multidrug transport system ATPase subunit